MEAYLYRITDLIILFVSSFLQQHLKFFFVFSGEELWSAQLLVAALLASMSRTSCLAKCPEEKLPLPSRAHGKLILRCSKNYWGRQVCWDFWNIAFSGLFCCFSFKKQQKCTGGTQSVIYLGQTVFWSKEDGAWMHAMHGALFFSRAFACPFESVGWGAEARALLLGIIKVKQF